MAFLPIVTLRTHTHTLTCVAPAGDVTVIGLFEHSLFPLRQTGGEDMTAE